MVVIHNLRNEVKIRQFWGVNVHIPDILIVEAKVHTLNTLMHPEQSHISSLSAHSTNRCTYKAFPSHCLHSYSTNTSGLIYPFSPLSPLCIRPKSNNECFIFSKLCSLLRFTNTKPRNISRLELIHTSALAVVSIFSYCIKRDTFSSDCMAQTVQCQYHTH